jgi:CHAD domain-containing protein
VRKALKKLRALVRLVRSELGDATFSRENQCFRELGQSLSSVRDRAASLESFDKLLQRQPDAGAFGDIREHLSTRTNLELHGVPPPPLSSIQEALRAGLLRVSGWPIERPTWNALEWGFRKGYRDGQVAHDLAIHEPSAEHFHDWRKRVKDHLYHLRLLANIWPLPLKARRGELDDLADLLGDEHDLVELRRVLVEDLPGITPEVSSTLLTNIEKAAGDLRARAHFLGLRVYAERPSALVRRMRTYYDVWRAESLG